MQNSKRGNRETAKRKGKSGRPRKTAQLHEGKTAMDRFKAGINFALKGGA